MNYVDGFLIAVPANKKKDFLAQAEKMAQIVLNGLLSSPNPSLTIVDAYCGVGTFALLLARNVGKVILVP